MIDIELFKDNTSERVHFKKGEIIIKEGEDPCNKIYFILSGGAEVFKNYQSPGQIKIATMGPGDFFGEMALFLERCRTASVVVNEDVTAITIAHENALSFFAARPEIAYAMMKTLCQRLDRTNMDMTSNYVQYEQDLMSLNSEKTKLEIAANVDALTGVFNRRGFMKAAKSRLSSAQSAFITLLDLDHFKSVNDTYGHAAGDLVLKRVAETVSHSVRQVDLFARYGGEEFILLTVGTPKPATIGLLERIRLSIRNTAVEFDGAQIRVSASFGVAPASNFDTLSADIGRADEALYKAKNDGRDRVIYYEAG